MLPKLGIELSVPIPKLFVRDKKPFFCKRGARIFLAPYFLLKAIIIYDKIKM